MTKPYDQLLFVKSALALLTTPNGWTSYFLAKDRFGNEVAPTDPKAVCFCASGALTKVQAPLELRLLINRQVMKRYGHLPNIKQCHFPLVTLNDYVGYEAVIDVFVSTIKELSLQ